LRRVLALLELLRVGDPDREGHVEALEQRPALGRARGEHQRQGRLGGCRRAAKNSAASRAADSGESEPWTMFAPISIAKSPRIEPGVDATGSVAPLNARTPSTA